MPDNVKRGTWVARVLQTVLNIGLLLLGVILIVFLAKETYALIQVLFINSAKSSSYLLIEGIVI